MYNANPPTCSISNDGGMTSSWVLTRTSSGGATVMQDALERWSQLLGALDGDPEHAGGLGEFREVRIHEIDAAVEKPRRPHLELHKAKGCVVEHHELDR